MWLLFPKVWNFSARPKRKEAHRGHKLSSGTLGVIACLLVGRVYAGPVEFGLAELKRAAVERGLPAVSIKTEITGGASESYSVRAGQVSGGDSRGVMYGLLEAAEQIRQTGRLEASEGKPFVPIRGIRTFIHNEQMERQWYYSREYWDSYFSMLARNRLNRFNLVFAHSTNYMTPPYPFWVELPEFPQIRAIGLSAEQRDRNIQMLCYISESAASHGVDFTLGIWQQNTVSDYQEPTVSGINERNIGPYSYAALKKVLKTCTSIRSVQLRTNSESGIPEEQQVSFFRDWLFRAIQEAGRPVTLDLRGWLMKQEMLDAAIHSGVPLRLSVKYSGEKMARPYQPIETYSGFSYLDLLRKPRAYDLYWEIWALGSHRLLLWGDPAYVRRIAPTLLLSKSGGFEIDAPLAQKGFGNVPETWGVFEKNEYVSHENLVFWNWEFERYWLFYLLWGRITYDPNTPDDLWIRQLRNRFGSAAADVLTAYQSASQVVSEIVATHSVDPDQTVWEEINPGGLIAAYKDTSPFDSSFIAKPSEAARNVLRGHASAKQSPQETAQLLDHAASAVEAAVNHAQLKLGNNHQEWRGTAPDFQVLAYLARYHARKQEAAYSLSWFYETGNLASLDRAETELNRALAIWKQLVRLTDGLYPNSMVYGPLEIGHWKDKLPYVYHDIAWIQALKLIHRKYGGYSFRFQFGDHKWSPNLGTFFDGPFISGNYVEPRFTLVHSATMYSEESGYGWYGGWYGGEVPPTMQGSGHKSAPYREIQTLSSRPENLPEHMLFKGFLSVPDMLNFRVRTGPGEFEVVTIYPDGFEYRESLLAQNGVVDVAFPPNRPRRVSGVVLRRVNENIVPPVEERYAKSKPRPLLLHTAPLTAVPGRPLKLSMMVKPGKDVVGVRLHYRLLNSLSSVRTLEASGSSVSFVIPGNDIVADFDLLYHFEVLHRESGGWFYPNPLTSTPYYVVTVEHSAQIYSSASRRTEHHAR